jgi:hypothetical protein
MAEANLNGRVMLSIGYTRERLANKYAQRLPRLIASLM